MAKNDDLKKKYEKLKSYEEEARTLSKELDDIEDRSFRISQTIEALDKLSGEEEGSNALFPIADGIFVKGKLVDNSGLLVNSGSGTVVEKSVDETKQMLEKQSDEMEEYKQRIMSRMTSIDEKAYEIQYEITKDSR